MLATSLRNAPLRLASVRKARVAAAVIAGLGLSSIASAASFTLPSVNIPNVTTTEQLVPLNVSGVPNLVYDQYTFTVNWSAVTAAPNDPFSNEARMRLLSGATNLVGGTTSTTGIAPTGGSASSAAPTTLTWTGDLLSPYTGGQPLSIGARQTFTNSVANWSNATLTVSQAPVITGGNYAIDDGTAEDSIGVNGTAPFDFLWLNKFPVQSGGEKIETVQIAFGNPGNTSAAGVPNGTPVQVLLYEDANGGSTTDAVLKTSVMGTVQNRDSNGFVTFDIPDTVVTGTMLVGAVMRNLPGGNGYIAGIDQTDPDLSNRSFIGFTTGTTTPPSPLDINNLGSLGANYGSTDGFGLPGNFLIRATGSPVPEPTSLALIGLAGFAAVRRKRS